jgi:hypothetical protein
MYLYNDMAFVILPLSRILIKAGPKGPIGTRPNSKEGESSKTPLIFPPQGLPWNARP